MVGTLFIFNSKRRYIMFSSIDTIWVLLGAVLVFFMQAGFTMVETGLTRAKNAGNIVMKNLMDFSIGTIAYWLVGFGIMFGVSTAGFFGSPDVLVLNGTIVTPANVSPSTFFIFQTMFCATSPSLAIPSGMSLYR